MGAIYSAQSNYDNDLRREKTNGGMQERIRRGGWPFQAPIGYRKVRLADNSPGLEQDAEVAPFIRTAFERVAAGARVSDVVRQLNGMGMRTRSRRQMTTQSLHGILRNRAYAGYLSVREWQLNNRGPFAPIVSEELFNEVQRVLGGHGPRKRRPSAVNADFPLRQFARCKCGAGLTGSKSKGRSDRYAYYRCLRCKRVNFRAEAVVGQFVQVMERLRLRQEFASAFNAVLHDAWAEREKNRIESTRTPSGRIQDLDRKKADLTDLYIDRGISQKDFEEHRDRLQCARDAAERQLSDNGFPLEEFTELLVFAERLLMRLPDLWNRANTAEKMRIQRAIFPEGIEITPNGIGTAKCALFFNHLDVATSETEGLVDQTGIEPVTS
jgi:site-specific DNA recombinase